MAENEFVLKHKEIPIMIFLMDEINYKLLGIKEILDEERLPFGIKDRGNMTQYAIQFNNWLACRGLSGSRKDLGNIKIKFDAKSAKELMVKSYGLNLTDHYWLHKTDENILWKDKNYFDNTFDKVIPGKEINPEIDESVNQQSPNFCVDGSIEKRWIIKNDHRVLLKGSMYRRMQEPFNEVIASRIMHEYGINHVDYKCFRTKDKNIPYCECNCMIDKNIEYINALYVFNSEEYYRKDPYKHYLEICKKNGIDDAKPRVDEMIALDFIIGNVDRHKGNFGILRDADTLEWTGISPVFDNGNCLFYDSDEIEDWGIDTIGKAFGDSNRMNLQNIGYPDWYEKNNNRIIIDIIYDELSKNERLKTGRIERIINIVRKRIEVFEKSLNYLAPPLAMQY